MRLTWHTPARPTYIAVLILHGHHPDVTIKSCATCSAEHFQPLLKLKEVITDFVMAFRTLKPSFTARCLKNNLDKQWSEKSVNRKSTAEQQ
jgi:hypothetical protein